MKKENYKNIIQKYLENICPIEDIEKLNALDDPQRFIFLSTRFPQLAADTVLRKGIVGKLTIFIIGAIGQVGSIKKEERDYQNFYESLIEVCLNLFGLESKRAGFSSLEIDQTIKAILDFFQKEKEERGEIIDKAIKKLLEGWNRVLNGKSLAAQIAKNIEKKLDRDNLAESFIAAAKTEIQENVYYKMADKGFSKFGNDSATGLRLVRHFDFVQVSSNPVIAARAYEEFPELWDNFKEIIETNEGWQKNPEKYKEEITLYATINSLLPNLLVFRPIALLSDFHDGLVSYQLNPFLAENPRASIKDAELICSILKDILYQYDQWLGWDVTKWGGRPNIVFKVAASSPKAIEITRGLNERGIGSNNTVTYSVSQEITLLLTEAEGMAKAMEKGILPSQVYQTNMIGRTEDHLKEAEAEKLISKLSEKDFWKLAKEILGKTEIKESRQEITKEISSKKYLKSLNDERLAKILKKYLDENVESLLSQSEEDIQHSGIFVTRRVYEIFFEQKLKILEWLQKKFKVSEEQAKIIFERIDLLPASKRRAEDTYLVLGTPNITNTEFPDQQMKVYLESRKEDFDLEKYRQSITKEADPSILKRLMEIEDFQKVYELTPELSKKLKEIGIEGNFVHQNLGSPGGGKTASEARARNRRCLKKEGRGEPYDRDFGSRGMKPKNWKDYGAVQKTMNEFKNAYQNFREKVLEFAKF